MSMKAGLCHLQYLKYKSGTEHGLIEGQESFVSAEIRNGGAASIFMSAPPLSLY